MTRDDQDPRESVDNPLAKQSADTTVILRSLQYVESLHVNVAQPIIVTTEDKIHRCLTAHASRIENRRAWIAPAGIFVTVMAVLVTCKFQDFVLAASVWNAMFVLAAIGSCLWLIVALLGLRKVHTVEQVIEELKQNSLHRKP